MTVDLSPAPPPRQSVLSGDGTGHDWWHVYRVWIMAKRIGHVEQADLLVVELGALLHNIAEWKLHDMEDYLQRIYEEWEEAREAVVEDYRNVLRRAFLQLGCFFC